MSKYRSYSPAADLAAAAAAAEEDDFTDEDSDLGSEEEQESYDQVRGGDNRIVLTSFLRGRFKIVECD